MKNFLLKIVFAGLTLGLVPHGAFAMQSTHDMQLRSRNQFTAEENHDFLHLYEKELDKKYPPTWRKRIKIWAQMRDKAFDEELLKSAPTARQLDYYISSQDRKDLTACAKGCIAPCIAPLIVAMIVINLLNAALSPACPSLNPTYKETLQINTGYEFNGILKYWSCIFDSKKYGKLMPIDQELQETASPNFAFMQLKSVAQEGPTCAKYAFANLAAIDQLYSDGKSINAQTIAQQMKLPLETIGLPGQIEWKPLDSMQSLSDHSQDNSILNYAKIFFPKGNLVLWNILVPQRTVVNYEGICDFIESEQIETALVPILDNIKTQGIVHIYTGCDKHATAISIIKEGENNYRVIYMNSHNRPLSSAPGQIGWDATKQCYHYVKSLVTQLRDTFTPNQPTITLSDAIKN